MIFDWFRGLIGQFDPNKYNGDWYALEKFWNDHNSGVRSWDNVNATNATITNVLANIAMGGFKLTGLGAGTTNGDSLRFEQLKILQIVQGFTTTATSTSSTTFVDTNLSASITPSSSSNKVLILVSGLMALGSASANRFGNLTLLQGSTNLGDGTNGFGAIHVAVAGQTNNTFASIVYLDSPATTSSVTYKIQIRVGNGADTMTFPGSAQPATMMLMETK